MNDSYEAAVAVVPGDNEFTADEKQSAPRVPGWTHALVRRAREFLRNDTRHTAVPKVNPLAERHAIPC